MAISIEKKYKLGLVLSGGGARGFAHLGALKAMEDAGKKPDIISGTSAGALAGVFYADGYSPEEIIHLFIGKDLRKFVDLQIPKAAIFGTSGFRQFLKKNLRAKNFEDLSIPLRVATTNLDEGRSVIFEQGVLLDPIVASCSIPIVFNPVVIDGVNYVDGGLFKNLPVSIIRSECDHIIGVNVNPLVPKKYNESSILHIAERSFHYLTKNNTLLDRQLCDTLIEMNDLTYFKTFDLVSAEKIFKIGYDYAQKAFTNEQP